MLVLMTKRTAKGREFRHNGMYWKPKRLKRLHPQPFAIDYWILTTGYWKAATRNPLELIIDYWLLTIEKTPDSQVSE